MPFVTLPKEKNVRIYYEFYNNSFDRKKPTVLVLPPTISCSAVILQHVFPQLPEITRNFNCLSLDLRGHGRGDSERRKDIDCFVFAVDIAFVLNALKITSVHLVGNSYVSGPTAFAFTVMFPTAVLSLSILGVAPVNSIPSQIGAVMELLEGWLQGEDEEALFESMTAILDLAFTASLIEMDLDLRDWLSTMWFRRIGPHRAKSTFVVTAPVLINPGITPEESATIACPVLLVQGTDDMMKGTPVAQEVLDSLIGTDDVSLITVEAGVCFVGIANISDSGPILTQFLLSHASILPSPIPIVFPAPPRTASEPFTSLSYCRYDESDPLLNQVWELCCQLDGKCFVTFADREKEAWEEGGRLHEMHKHKWRFSQRNRNARPISRRGSVPMICKQDQSTSVITVEDFPLPPLEGYGNYRRLSGVSSSVEFKMECWKWDSPAPFSSKESGMVAIVNEAKEESA
ncbi:hypothetical protein JCM5353_003012 [Sporobolomyces roseus]